MQVNKGEEICCPHCGAELGAVEQYVQDGDGIHCDNDCPKCDEVFVVMDYCDGTFEVNF